MKKLIPVIALSLVSSQALANGAERMDRDLERALDKVCQSDECLRLVKSTMASHMAVLVNRNLREAYFENLESLVLDARDLSCEDISREAKDRIDINPLSEAAAYAAHYMVRCRTTMKEDIKSDF